jgi:hypothetical protein
LTEKQENKAILKPGTTMKTLRIISVLLLSCGSLLLAAQNQTTEKATPPQNSAPGEDISGMYTFLREGEFVQVTVEEGNQVSGFVSRYGDSDSDKGTFLDQFFSKASLDGNHLTFTTKPIHGVWFEFDGIVVRGPGKTPHEEGYRLLKGTLRQFNEDSKKGSKSRQVELKSFPQDLDEEPPTKQ